MSDDKLVNVPLGGHFKLPKAQILTMEDEKALMLEVSYASAVDSLIAMVYTRSDIAQAAGVVSRYNSNSGKEYWRAVKGSSDMTSCYDGTDVRLHRHYYRKGNSRWIKSDAKRKQLRSKKMTCIQGLQKVNNIRVGFN